MIRALLSAAFTVLAVSALAQSPDAGLVLGVTGAVVLTSSAGSGPIEVKTFMKLREGDRVTIPNGAVLGVVYFDGARQETWRGPATFRIGRNGPQDASAPAAQVATLPPLVPQRLARLPQLDLPTKNMRLGGSTVRGGSVGDSGGAMAPKARDDSEQVYEQIRSQAGDDLAADLFLFAALNQRRAYGEMRSLVARMAARQPGSAEITALSEWLKSESGR